jgi:hypothetical protein
MDLDNTFKLIVVEFETPVRLHNSGAQPVESNTINPVQEKQFDDCS